MPGFRTGTRSDEVDILVRGSITAVRTLTTGDAPFLPFVAVPTGRCAVVYQRFDGGLGLVTTLW